MSKQAHTTLATAYAKLKLRVIALKLALSKNTKLTRGAEMIDIPAIKAKAEAVLAQNDVAAPIINVFELASTEGIEVKYRVFPKESRDISGFYFQKDRAIYINVDDSAERQIFTVAHELGHYFLDHKPNEYGVYARKNTYVGVKHDNEREADCFAANLLMPEYMINQELRKYPFLKGNPSLLALRFGVSASAMTNRMKNLGIIKR